MGGNGIGIEFLQEARIGIGLELTFFGRADSISSPPIHTSYCVLLHHSDATD